MRYAAAALTSLVTLGVLLATPNRAEAQQAQLGLRFPVHTTPSSSFDAVHADPSYGAVGLDASLTLDEWLPIDGLRGVADVEATGTSAPVFRGDYQLDWSRGVYLLGADWGYDFRDVFRPYVRLTGGFASQKLLMNAPGLDAPVSQNAVSFATKNSVGADLSFPIGEPDDDNFALSRHATLGVTAQVGFLAQTDAAFDELRPSEATYADQEQDWQRSGYDLGSLEVGSGFWDVGIFGAYRF